jgi:hypothetical protein
MQSSKTKPRYKYDTRTDLGMHARLRDLANVRAEPRASCDATDSEPKVVRGANSRFRRFSYG